MIYFVIGAAGVLGALCRYGAGLLTIHWLGSSFPWGTLVINWTGCLFLGWFMAKTAQYPSLHKYWRAGIGIGFIGSYTTFSTFSVETIQLLKEGNIVSAVIYIAASLWGGLLLVWMGNRLAGWGLGKRSVHGEEEPSCGRQS